MRTIPRESPAIKYLAINGTVEAGYEPVAEAFADNFRRRRERGAACTIYHRGQKVVDIWAGTRCHRSEAEWERETLSLVFSVTKGMAAAAMAVAHGKGYFELDAPVADYWPEFGTAGKSSITVRQLMSHQAGVITIDRPVTPQDLADHDRMGRWLAQQEPLWKPGQYHGYHTFTLGWYQNELIRRTDPQGRTLGQFFDAEIARPLDADFYIGLPESVPDHQISRTHGYHKIKALAHLNELPPGMIAAGIWPRSLTARSVKFMRLGDPATLADPKFRRVEIPSAGGFGQARAVARIYDVLARGGQELGLDGKTFGELCRPATMPERGSRDVVLKLNVGYGFGFSKPSDGFQFGSDEAAFGCPGAGGCFAMADPSTELAFAYLTNTMSFRIFDDPRERAVREAMYRCAGASTLNHTRAA
ncbi:serine hydrolase domain-containing protein [Roseiconus lacunae]|uniref:Serine hydrolase domain-containing protein n=1 Tax=Roseiconus lacunae TaxID=2605694 RepID=A0ABT7PG98_9BACT|nr:serine hydrolase domain-containing protein [Roseiconus lacunae]MDM4015500.1 serine hydrolase domain-containing protein [Roseiconus lacunae]WRQ52823.1 serine hydrolase domain-containing protein [Stieleria sp. HD01]